MIDDFMNIDEGYIETNALHFHIAAPVRSHNVHVPCSQDCEPEHKEENNDA